MTKKDNKHSIAIWALTPNGVMQAIAISNALQDTDVYLSHKLNDLDFECNRFEKLSDTLPSAFNNYSGHIFIMSTGIVVRQIADLIAHKTKDPAVIVMDEKGQHVISLLSGHIGGANELTHQVSKIIGAIPVITTATDINNAPAIDLFAKENNLFIENPETIKNVNMAFITGEKVLAFDPYGLIGNNLSSDCFHTIASKDDFTSARPGFTIDDKITDLPEHILVLRPKSLAAGMGCNRGTDVSEMRDLLSDVLIKNNLSINSIESLASIDIKSDEVGLLALSDELNIPLQFFNKETLNNTINIETPSEMVNKHIGVKSVCEAAAIQATKMGTLIVTKQKTKNVTVAIARKNFM